LTRMKIIFPFAAKVGEPLTLLHLFIVLSFAVVLLGWIALVLTLASAFYLAILIPVILIIVVAVTVYLKRYKSFGKPARSEVLALAFVLIFAVLTSVYFHDTFSGGRDDGLYTNHAVYLSQNHSLSVDGYSNLPGLFSVDDSYTSIRYPGYVAWVALNCIIFGTAGVYVSNFLLIIIGLMSLYFIGKKIKNGKVGIITVIMLATAFPFIWFTRRTFSEILLFALIWFAILCFIEAHDRKQSRFWIPMFFACGLSLATRSEALPIIILLFVIFVFLVFREKEKLISKWGIVIFLITLVPFIYWSAATHVGQFWFNDTISQYKSIFISSSSSVSVTPVEGVSTLRSHQAQFVFQMLSEYSLYWFILLIPLAFIGSFIKKDKKVFKYLFITLLIILPTFVYLIRPYITIDQPWFLRRYVFTILPFAFLCSSIFLFEVIKRKVTLSLVVIMIIILNLVVASPILAFSDNKGMLKNMENLCGDLSAQDLILVDRYTLKNYMMADPMFFVYGKHALWLDGDNSSVAYDEGYYQIRSAVNFSQFEHIYIITNPSRSQYYSVIKNGKASMIYNQSVTYQYLEKTVDVIHIPGSPPDQNDIAYNTIVPMIERPSDIETDTTYVQVYEVYE